MKASPAFSLESAIDAFYRDLALRCAPQSEYSAVVDALHAVRNVKPTTDAQLNSYLSTARIVLESAVERLNELNP